MRPRRISFSNTEPFRQGPPSPSSPRSPSLSSLQAAATINSTMHRSATDASPRHSLHRRSSLMNNLHLNDPTIPGPGEMQASSSSDSAGNGLAGRLSLSTADPHHQRTPSLGQMHQALENEQEAQVNRLLHMIRIQQDQLAALQAHQHQQALRPSSPGSSHPSSALNTPASTLPATGGTSGADITDDNRPRSLSHSHSHSGQSHAYFNHLPSSLSPKSSARFSNAGTSPHSGSPALHPAGGSIGPLTEEFLLGGTRDESAFYQAETQMLTRENQMLKLRIRELEKQITDFIGASATSSNEALSHSPAQHSPLASPLASQDAPAHAPVVAEAAVKAG